jgi:hypothetical protein
MKINKLCKFCNNEFLADTREINRGHALFCNLSCSQSYNNSQRELTNLKIHVCKHCSKEFKSVSNYSKYCSKLCKAKNYRIKKKSNNPFDRKLEELIREYPCEICNWSEYTRDVHHIIPVSKDGKSVINNLISLCPNHHKMADHNLFSQDYLLKIAKFRTISSSLESLLIKIKSKEQDANSGN